MRYKTQMTNISWYFDHYGPYSSDVYNILHQDKDIKVQKDTSNFGTVRYVVEPRKDKDSLNYVGLSDKEIEDFYDRNKDKFIEPAAIAASHILVEKEDDAKKIIADLSNLKGDELKKKFAEIAKEKSIDPSGKQNGGDLGYFIKEQMVPEFGEAADKLKKGELTKTPVKTKFGYHIILKNDAKDKKQLDLAEVKDHIKNIVKQEKFQADFEKKIKDLKSKAKIEYKK